MKTRFKTPVSMKCTQEQYDQDLKEPLRKLGYVEGGMGRGEKAFEYLMTNWTGVSNRLGIYDEINAKNNRHLIETYNPKLFLALAAMTKGKDWIVGEWGEFRNCTFKKTSKKKLIKQLSIKTVYTLQDLKDGKVAVENNGTIEQLREVITYCFPEDKFTTTGLDKFYNGFVNNNIWIFSDETTLPTVSINTLHEELMKLKEEKKVTCKELISKLDELLDNASEVKKMIKELNKNNRRSHMV